MRRPDIELQKVVIQMLFVQKLSGLSRVQKSLGRLNETLDRLEAALS